MELSETPAHNEAQVMPVDEVERGLPDLEDSALYLNRELSLLEFNRRVLALACDPDIPLLERLRFLTICSTNLDEFFEIRVAGLKEQRAYGLPRTGADQLSVQEALHAISERAHALVDEQYRVLQEELLPGLAEQGIQILRRGAWDKAQAAWVREYFEAEVLPVLTPMGLDPAHPFPRVLNKSLTFIVSVSGNDAFGRDSGIAVIQVPRCLPRVIALPRDVAGAPHTFILLSAILHAHVSELFPSMAVTGCYAFRVTRNSDLWVDEEETEDLLNALKGELRSRNYSEAVRLEVADSCDHTAGEFLLSRFKLDPEDLYRVNGPVNLHRLVAVYDLVDRPDLKFAPFIPGGAITPLRGTTIFDTIRRGDLLLHHPFDSFVPVLEMVREATRDPRVLAIKQTLYRTGTKSDFVEALIDAARAGKEVTVVIELRARFDEAENIDLATRLQEVGANVVYGIVGYKTHAKMLLIIRREGGKLKRYVHLGTGNYHTGTARAYTDLSLITDNPIIGEDVHTLFMQLTGLGEVVRLKKLLQSPFTLHQTLIELIEAEAEEARQERPACIMAKMNSLSEPGIVKALYRASQAGVQVDLIVRGICCLRPGIPGVSENIRVRSILGRFLEHSRVYHFHAGGAQKTFCSSADWMPRNLLRRVETCFPIEAPELKARVIEEGLKLYLEDTIRAWELRRHGSYEHCQPLEAAPCSAQDDLLLRSAE